MKPAAAFLALLALACLPSAAAQPAPVAKFLASHFEPDLQASASPLLPNGSYYLVSAGGNETYVIAAADGGKVAGQAELEAILAQDARSRGGYDALVSSAASFASQADAAKQASEAKCVQYIGDDAEHPCADRDTCLVSCFSVPQCDIIVQSDGFLEAMMDWNLKRKAFASGLEAFSSGIDAVRFDARAIDAKTAILANLSSLAANMSQNGIFLEKEQPGCTGANATRRCYEYCPRIDYSPPLIASQAQGLASLKATLYEAASQGGRADAILQLGAKNDEYLASRGREYEDFRVGMQNDIRTLKAEAAGLSLTVRDSQVPAMLSQLQNISALAANYSGGGYYKKALALRPGFESLSNATSERIGADRARYASLSLGMEGYAGKVQNSAWLIGNESAEAHLRQLASLKGHYSAPLLPAEISEANATLSQMDAELASEIASKTVQAGSSSQPQPPSRPVQIADFAWAAAAILAAALACAFVLRFARRAPPQK